MPQGPSFPRHNRAEGREQFVDRDAAVLTVGEVGSIAGQDVVGAGRVAVVVVAVSPEDREFVGDPGTTVAVLADESAWDRGLDRLVRASDFGGGVRLQVPHVDRRGTALQEQEYAGFRPRAGHGRAGGFRFELEESSEGQPADEAGGADPEHPPTRETAGTLSVTATARLIRGRGHVHSPGRVDIPDTTKSFSSTAEGVLVLTKDSWRPEGPREPSPGRIPGRARPSDFHPSSCGLKGRRSRARGETPGTNGRPHPAAA